MFASRNLSTPDSEGRLVSRGGRSIAGALAIAGLCFAIHPVLSSAQGLRTVIESHSKTFPDVGVGVSAIKRDSSGRYFILAKPESLISIYDPPPPPPAPPPQSASASSQSPAPAPAEASAVASPAQSTPATPPLPSRASAA